MQYALTTCDYVLAVLLQGIGEASAALPGLAKGGEFAQFGETVTSTGDSVCRVVEAAAHVSGLVGKRTSCVLQHNVVEFGVECVQVSIFKWILRRAHHFLVPIYKWLPLVQCLTILYCTVHSVFHEFVILFPSPSSPFLSTLSISSP